MLEKMISLCNQLDENGKPYSLVFNDLSFNQSYYVEVKSFTPEMSVGRNMIWYYSLNMIAISPAKLTLGKRARRIAQKIVQTESTKVLKALTTETGRNELSRTKFN